MKGNVRCVHRPVKIDFNRLEVRLRNTVGRTREILSVVNPRICGDYNPRSARLVKETNQNQFYQTPLSSL